jgi:hypothetical protein
MNYDEFFNTYNPIKNHLDTNASLNGCMFETFGEELDYVKAQPNKLIWTYCDDGDTAYLVSGFHLVNRLGYLVGSKPFTGKEYTTVHLHTWEENDE